MAASNLWLFSILLALILTTTTAVSATEDDNLPKSEISDSSLKIELDQLNSKITFLESSIDERSRELKSNDEMIKQMEKIIHEKSATIAILHSEIQSLQGSLDAKEQIDKAHVRAVELEKQIDKLEKEIERQNQKKDVLEARANVAEKKILEVNSKIENLQRINDEQKSRIRKTERALRLAEEEMMKAKLEATSFSKDLIEVREAWLPPWLAVHLVHCQSFIATQWKEHGRPALDVMVRKALEKKDQVQKWAEPHIQTVKTKWIPIIKEHWLTFVTNIEPHVQLLSARTIEVYHASKNSIEPHVVKVQEMVDPYIQEAKKFTKPYVDQVATVTKPHVNKARVTLKPYTKKVLRTYRKFMKTASIYHSQVQGTIHESLENNEFTRPVASKELSWFMASALMSLPVLFLFKLSSNIFSKKPKKRTRNSHTSHARRRPKRVHPDK
ncbi:uncharacterized protein LOC132279550 isoform X2 [Cornus florida]|uniref:uncharacterized protein LOC132279550 isoform X2 n=1 Tax=Cornus florida TaxID=4283 RepID=UPI00289E0704|nr:uncharacterized protein LOC132279550 isoform X2 [Cornus florida]